MPEYRQKELQKQNESSFCACGQCNKSDWQTEATFSPEALTSSVKVKQVLEKAQNSIEKGHFFIATQFETSVLAKRREYVHEAANGVLQRYKQSESLAKQVVEITKQVKEFVNMPSSFHSISYEQKTPIETKLKAISDSLIVFRDQVMAEKGELEKSPLANDPRTIKKNIQDFDKLGLQHQNYLRRVQEWKQKQVFADTASEIDCWTWKGKLNAIKIIEDRCASLENSLRATECSLNALQNNANNPNFAQSNPVREGSRVFVMGMRPDGTAFLFPFSDRSNAPAAENTPFSSPFGSNARSSATGVPFARSSATGTPFSFATGNMPSPFGSRAPSSANEPSPSSSRSNAPSSLAESLNALANNLENLRFLQRMNASSSADDSDDDLDSMLMKAALLKGLMGALNDKNKKSDQ